MTRAHVHPRMTARLTSGGFFPHSVTVQVASRAADSTGELQTSAWNDVANMRALPCRISPSTGQQERNLDFGTVTEVTHVILISGNYADLLTTANRLKGSDGVLYDVRGVVADSTGTTTRVLARAVSH